MTCANGSPAATALPGAAPRRAVAATAMVMSFFMTSNVHANQAAKPTKSPSKGQSAHTRRNPLRFLEDADPSHASKGVLRVDGHPGSGVLGRPAQREVGDLLPARFPSGEVRAPRELLVGG